MPDILVSPLAFIGLAAAEPDCSSMAELITALNKITSGLQPLFLPLAGLGLTIFFLLLLGAPILPEAAQGAKGYFMRAALIVTVVGIIPTIFGWLGSLGGTAECEAAMQIVTPLLNSASNSGPEVILGMLTAI